MSSSTFYDMDCSVDSRTPNLNITSCDTQSIDSFDHSDVDTSFVAFRKFTMSPVRNRDSYQVVNDEVDIGMRRLSFKANTCPSTKLNFRPSEYIVVQPIDGVIRYHLHSNKTKGIVGQLILTSFRLKFVTYPQPNAEERNHRSEPSLRLPPFIYHSRSEDSEQFDEDINVVNIYDIRVEQEQSGSTLLTVYCNDFCCIEYQIRNTELVKSLLDNLERLTSEQSPLNVSSTNLLSPPNPQLVQDACPCLWYQLSTEYSFRYPQDWVRSESHWLQGKTSLRVTHCNDGFQMCSNLPPSFITLKYYLTDSTLIELFSPQLRNHRVPVVCYSRQMIDSVTRKELHGYNLLIRSVVLTENLTNIMTQAISPLRVIDVNLLLPSLVTLVAAYTKLRAACFLYSSTNHFLCRIGKWLKIVSKVLSVVKGLYKIVQNEASLVIMEDTDRHWNPLLSSLIQIMLDPYRRTIKGFESLISKEWIYLCGVSNKPNHVLFTLFLDCVWQLKSQNAFEFEFTSLYLVHVFDLLYIPESAVTLESTEMSNDAAVTRQTKNDVTHATLRQLNVDQLMFIYNPLFAKESNKNLKLRTDILGLELWRPLYLRWHALTNPIDYYNQFHTTEFIYFNSLLLSLYKYNVKKLVTNEDEEHHL